MDSTDICMSACCLEVRMSLEGPEIGRLDTGFSWFSCLQSDAELILKFQITPAFFL
jgi:hypothetical protein